jgi:nucleoside-diphosphate-sugar epimerase
MVKTSESQPDKKRVLLTGATGFLGSNIVKRLLEDGHELIILKRSFSNIHRLQDIWSEIVSYDLDKTDLETPFRDFDRIDAVIHTATVYGRKNEEFTDLFEANTVFPMRLLNAAIKFNVSTYFNTDTPLDKQLNFYALSKSQFREWGECLAKLGQIRFVNIKLEQMFGPGDEDSKFPAFVIRKCLSSPELDLTLGEQNRDFIHIDDVISAYGLLLQKVHLLNAAYQEYELGSGKAISICNFVELVKQLTGSSIQLNFGAFPYREGEVMYSEANLVALEGLGWSPKMPLEEGLRQTISWYQENK